MNTHDHPPLFIDDDGIERGYYVYVHANKSTGRVFYVGKGKEARAWDVERRSDAWKKFIAGLADGYEVRLIKTGLSESEAFEEEAKAVNEHGGGASQGGTLVNWIPGGEDPVSVTFAIGCDPASPYSQSSLAYAEARVFRKLSRRDQEAHARALRTRMTEVVQRLTRYRDEQRKAGDAVELTRAETALSDDWGFESDTSDFLRRRTSWQDYCLSVEWRIDSLRDRIAEESLGEVVTPLATELLGILDEWFALVDSGNRKEAEAASHAAWVQAHGGDEKAAWANMLKTCTEALARYKAEHGEGGGNPIGQADAHPAAEARQETPWRRS